MASEKPITVQRGSYTIQKLPAIPAPFETHPFIFKASILTTWSLWALYIACQIASAVELQYTRQEKVQWVVVISEILLDFPSAVLAFSIVLGLFSVPDEGPRPRYSLLDGPAPDVDVLVTCCGESVGIISNTVAAAVTQDYPKTHLKVYILDDGHSEELRSTIESLNFQMASRSTESAPIIYLSRKLNPNEHSHFKSGNLRYGIHESQTRFRERLNGAIDEEPLERFIACLDADMIPTRDWLKKMVPHMLLNDDLGIVCPPQNYYNVPKNSRDILGQQTDFDIYFSVQEALNDRLGAAMCTGSGYVARRSALESIGGWPLADCGEDYMCSTILSDHGWGIAFVRENLQAGLAPANMATLLKQRMRWTDAGIEVHQRLGYYLPGTSSAIASRMTPGQRAVNMLYVLRDFSPLGITIAMLALPLAILLSPPKPETNPSSPLPYLKPLATTLFLLQKTTSWLLYRHLGLMRVTNFHAQEVWAAPCIPPPLLFQNSN
ncbi:MAG: hypothetical protein Q9195_008809 [Heterodermia aff. obscurata]